MRRVRHRVPRGAQVHGPLRRRHRQAARAHRRLARRPVALFDVHGAQHGRGDCWRAPDGRCERGAGAAADPADQRGGRRAARL
eukprot:1246745-Prymnesium_polylepis.1